LDLFISTKFDKASQRVRLVLTILLVQAKIQSLKPQLIGDLSGFLNLRQPDQLLVEHGGIILFLSKLPSYFFLYFFEFQTPCP